MSSDYILAHEKNNPTWPHTPICLGFLQQVNELQEEWICAILHDTKIDLSNHKYQV